MSLFSPPSRRSLRVWPVAALAAGLLAGCVVVPARPVVAEPVYVAPAYPAPGPGWAWRPYPGYGWGWYRQDRGWYHRGWR